MIFKGSETQLNKPMSINFYKIAIFFILVLGSVMPCQAQDIHFTQFQHSPLNLSPALTGIFNGDQRFIGNYRSQWRAALVPYTTFSGMVDSKIHSNKFKNGMLGIGAVFNYDVAGDGELGNVQLNLSGSYSMAVNRQNFLTIGIQAGIAQRSFRPASLTFDSQFDGEVFNPNLPINEQLTNTSKVYPDASIGVNWHGQKIKRRTRLDVGAGIFHITQPDQAFEEEDPARLSSRISFYLMPTFQVNKNIDLILNAMGQIQGTYSEGFAGIGGRVHLSQKKTKEMALQFTGAFRFNTAFGDSVIPAVELHYNTWIIGLSYDVNISPFQEATNRYGGPEIAIRYTVSNVKPINTFRICPII